VHDFVAVWADNLQVAVGIVLRIAVDVIDIHTLFSLEPAVLARISISFKNL
jgi:hypothetical protein